MAERLKAVSAALEALPNELIKYLKPTAGIYNCRAIAGTTALAWHEWKKIGIGEVPIVVRVFLAAHRAGGAGAGIEQPGFLDDRPALLEHVDLAPRLVLDRGHDEAHRIDVLGLGAGA